MCSPKLKDEAKTIQAPSIPRQTISPKLFDWLCLKLSDVASLHDFSPNWMSMHLRLCSRHQLHKLSFNVSVPKGALSHNLDGVNTTYCFISENVCMCVLVEARTYWRSEVRQTNSKPLRLLHGEEWGCRWWIAFFGRCVRTRRSHKLPLNDSLYRSSPCPGEGKWGGIWVVLPRCSAEMLCGY